MLIRVRCKAGTWRIPDLFSTSSIKDLEDWVEKNHGIPTNIQEWSLNPKGTDRLASSSTLSSANIKHGDLLYLEYEGDLATEVSGRKINADGTITATSHKDSKSGFRPGMKSLRDMKMHWTLGEFMRMDAQFEFKIARQKEAHCKSLTIDSASCNSFQSYLRQFAFQQSRCGWLYGTFEDDNNVKVECIYEPPQVGSPTGFEVLDDPNAEKVDAVASLLGLEKVGWVFSHPPREEESFCFSSREIMLAAQLQLDAGGKDSPFVTLKVTIDKEGHAAFEAFQVSSQCMDMFSAGALVENEAEPEKCAIADTFTALVEAKKADDVDNNFFLCVVPVKQQESFLKCNFPKLNREGSVRTREQLSQQLEKYKAEPYVKRISDLELLVFLTDFVDLKADLAVMCQSVINPDEVPFGAGFEMIIDSIAGRQTSF